MQQTNTTEIDEAFFGETQLNGAASRAALIDKIRLFQSIGDKVPENRSARFKIRAYAKDGLADFNAVSKMPAWAFQHDFDREKLSWAAGLVFYLPVIERALDGASLRALADAAGEELLDAVLDWEIPANVICAPSDDMIPDNDIIYCRGQEMVQTSAALVNTGQPEHTNALLICDLAYQLIVTAKAAQ